MCLKHLAQTIDLFSLRAAEAYFLARILFSLSVNCGRMCKWYWSLIFPWAKRHWTVIKFILNFRYRCRNFSRIYIHLRSPPEASIIDFHTSMELLRWYQLHLTFLQENWINLWMFHDKRAHYGLPQCLKKQHLLNARRKFSSTLQACCQKYQ